MGYALNIEAPDALDPTSFFTHGLAKRLEKGRMVFGEEVELGGKLFLNPPPEAGQAKPEEHREVPDKVKAPAERLRDGATVKVGFRGETPT